MARFGILYEHPQWFEPLFAELDRRSVPFERIHADRLVYDPAAAPPFDLVVNRMSPSAWLRGSAPALFSVPDYLAYLERSGVRVINGSRSFGFERSKALQLGLLAELGINHPRGRVITDSADALAAAEGLRYPVLVKPNIGGSGAGIVSFEDPDALAAAAELGSIDLGPDGSGLVQEHAPANGDAIYRLEFLDGRLLYGIRLLLVPGSFNLCPADYCDLPGIADGVSGRGLAIEAFEPGADVVRDGARLLAEAGADLGGVEYLIDARDGRPSFYDINALSNFVADAPEIVGFDPFVNLVDFIVNEATEDPRNFSLARENELAV